MSSHESRFQSRYLICLMSRLRARSLHLTLLVMLSLSVVACGFGGAGAAAIQIVEYLVGKYDDGTLLPEASTPQRLAYTYWLHYSEGTFAPLMIISLIMSRIETAPMPFFVKPIAKGIVGKVRAGRSLKPAKWPGGAQCAVALSFDSDHETLTLTIAADSIVENAGAGATTATLTRGN